MFEQEFQSLVNKYPEIGEIELSYRTKKTFKSIGVKGEIIPIIENSGGAQSMDSVTMALINDAKRVKEVQK